MGRDQNDDKKRALVMGKFKFLYQDDTEDLEAGDKFQLAIVQNKLLGKLDGNTRYQMQLEMFVYLYQSCG